MKENRLNEYGYSFSAGYKAVDLGDTDKILKYLLKNHNAIQIF